MRVEKAAICLNGIVYSLDRPNRHHSIIAFLVENGEKPPIRGEQGFVLSDGSFVNRKDALNIAIASGQVVLADCVAPLVGLFSEDLW